jgi:acetyl esterase/lipase
VTPAVRPVLGIEYAVIPGYRPLELDLYLPEAGEPAPVIVHVHGGG